MRFETLLPLIDVAFFLVIAFMMISHLTTARPFDVALPVSAEGGKADGTFVLYLSPEGVPGVVLPTAMTGEDALLALAAARADLCAQADCTSAPPALRIAADADTPAPALAVLLPRLAAMGFGAVQLVAVAGR